LLRRGEDELDADGRWLVPGLWDQHIHSGQWARSFGRIDLGPARSAAEVIELVRNAVTARPPAFGGLLEGYGFRDALWPDLPTTAALDAVAPHVPVVLVSGDVHCGWLNSAALRRLGLPPREGPLREHERFDVLSVVGEMPHARDDALRTAVEAAGGRGRCGPGGRSGWRSAPASARCRARVTTRCAPRWRRPPPAGSSASSTSSSPRTTGPGRSGWPPAWTCCAYAPACTPTTSTTSSPWACARATRCPRGAGC